MGIWRGFDESLAYAPPLVQLLSEYLRLLSRFLASCSRSSLPAHPGRVRLSSATLISRPHAFFGCQGLVRLCPLSTFRKRFLASFQDYNLKYYMELR